MIKKISFILSLLISVSIFSQNVNLDKYKYVVVADKFDYLKKVDQYQTSSLTKFLLKKKGFTVFLSNETLPQEIASNRCVALFAAVKDKSSMLTTKSVIELKDCFGKTLYSSEIGRSKYKDYKKAYQDAIRSAFESMEDLEYSYNPNLVTEKKIETKVVIPVKTAPKVIITPEVNVDANKVKNKVSETLSVLYAQPKNNGFQLVNLKPEVVFVILKTNVKDVFIIKDKNGSLSKNGEHWIAEFYENGKLVKKEYQIKF